jgi:hypothetical protein
MSDDASDAGAVLRSVWAATGGAADQLDEALRPPKPCRNMKDVSFDGMAEPGTDLREAWRNRLAREGKLSTAGGSVRDLVLGSDHPGTSD